MYSVSFGTFGDRYMGAATITSRLEGVDMWAEGIYKMRRLPFILNLSGWDQSPRGGRVRSSSIYAHITLCLPNSVELGAWKDAVSRRDKGWLHVDISHPRIKIESGSQRPHQQEDSEYACRSGAMRCDGRR